VNTPWNTPKPRSITFATREIFVLMIESAIRDMVTSPTRWNVVEKPEIRRYVCRRFPYVLYYRFELQFDRVAIYAVMHCSRKPGHWKHRTQL
jgi:toxin ParE1/3/4